MTGSIRYGADALAKPPRVSALTVCTPGALSPLSGVQPPNWATHFTIGADPISMPSQKKTASWTGHLSPAPTWNTAVTAPVGGPCLGVRARLPPASGAAHAAGAPSRTARATTAPAGPANSARCVTRPILPHRPGDRRPASRRGRQ